MEAIESNSLLDMKHHYKTTPLGNTEEGNMDVDPTQKGNRKRELYLYTMLAETMCLITGYQIGIMSGAMLILVDTFNFDTLWQQLVSSALYIGGAVSLFPAGYFAQLLGRKKVILGTNVIVCVGAIITASAPGKEVLLFGRFVTGLGISIPTFIVPLYISETAPVNIRGRLGSLTQLLVNVGILVAGLIGGAFNTVQDGWRYMFILSCALGIVQFIGFLFAPETPRWLVQKGRVDEARMSLKRLRDDPEDVIKELKNIQRAIAEAKKAELENANQSMIVRRVIRSGPVRRAVVIATCVAMIYQLSGIVVVVTNAGPIINMAGFQSGNAAWLATIPVTIQLLATFINTSLVERLGRKKLFVIACTGMCIANFILGLGFFISKINSPSVNSNIIETFENGGNMTGCHFRTCDECISSESVRCGFCYDDLSRATCLPVYDNGSATGGRCYEGNSFNNSDFKIITDLCPTSYGWIPVLGMCLHLLAFGAGAGVVWIIISEVFPLWARSACSSFATTVLWATQVAVIISFLSIVGAIDTHGTFWLYAAFCLCGAIYTGIFLPETSGTCLEDVEILFMSPQERKMSMKPVMEFVVEEKK